MMRCGEVGEVGNNSNAQSSYGCALRDFRVDQFGHENLSLNRTCLFAFPFHDPRG
jgi:hypothetical protein